MEKDLILEKYKNEGFGKNAFGWYFNPWIDEYDESYDPHNDPEYNKELKNKNEKINWHPKLTKEQIEELIAETIKPGDNEYDQYLWNHGINPFEKEEPKETNNEEKEKPINEDDNSNKTAPIEEPPKVEENEEKNEKPDLKGEELPDKPTILKIIVDLKNRELSYYLAGNTKNEIRLAPITRSGLDYSKRNFESDEIQKTLDKLQVELGDGYKIRAIAKNFDPNILDLISGDKELLKQYVQAIYSAEETTKSKLPFSLTYELGEEEKNLSLGERFNLRKVYNMAQKLENVKVNKYKDIWSDSSKTSVEKNESIFSRTASRVTSFIKSIGVKKVGDGKKNKNVGIFARIKNRFENFDKAGLKEEPDREEYSSADIIFPNESAIDFKKRMEANKVVKENLKNVPQKMEEKTNSENSEENNNYIGYDPSYWERK